MPRGPGIYERIKQRVEEATQSLTGEVPAAQEAPDEVLAEQTLTPGLWSRIKQRVKSLFPSAGEEKPTPVKITGLSMSEILQRFQQGGRGRLLVLMKYNGVWRHVEPYSFRQWSLGPQPLMYGFCRLHNTIEAYRPDRVQGLALTDEPYTPRWLVEF